MSERSGTITLLVSHRFNTVRMAYVIVYLEARQAIEAGSHDELMAGGGRYAELFTSRPRPTASPDSRNGAACRPSSVTVTSEASAPARAGLGGREDRGWISSH